MESHTFDLRKGEGNFLLLTVCSSKGEKKKSKEKNEEKGEEEKMGK